ncbi:MAG TPA: ATP-binding protein [Ignisphaera aggregans]|uniref:ATP-binding protein n=1 Tax=Ignisphaera aggregans TaxID=334771 RepID=A0A833DU98_9CREN|nr:ATP-binding protein [Ignisphaera aggregans]
MSLFIDPRLYAIKRRLAVFRLIVPIVSPKGGVGKSVIAAALSLSLALKGVRVGLLDLDITNPCSHLLLGIDVETTKPIEDRGIRPVKLGSTELEFMSIAFYSGNKTLPLRGTDIDNAIKEVLSITQWSASLLIIDTPPGFSDEVLDIISLAPNPRPIIVTTPSVLSIETVKRSLEVLSNEGVKPLGLIVNLSHSVDLCLQISQVLSLELLACIPWLTNLEKAVGKPLALKDLLEPYMTKAIETILRIVER